MAEYSTEAIEIIKPGIFALGKGLPNACSTNALFADKTVTQISCGKYHSAVVLASGQVYVFGKKHSSNLVLRRFCRNKQHSVKLMKDDGDDVISPPTLVTSLSHVKVVQAACGNYFTVLLTDKGQVYMCGDDVMELFGLCYTDGLVNGLPCIRKVAAGSEHSLVLTESGEVWGAGCNENGCLGITSRNGLLSFTRVQDLPGVIIDITCGSSFSALLTETGVILITGCNYRGQLGCKGGNLHKFTLVNVSHPVAAVSCGAYHTVCLRVDGSVWAWGSNDCRQLGNEVKDKTCYPKPVLGLKKYTASKVIGGYSHTAVVTTEGDVLLFGCGSLLGKRKDISVPTLIKKSSDLIVKQVAFASTYCLLLVTSKETESQTEEGVAKEKLLPKENKAGNTEIEKRAGITETEEKILKSLECPVCYKVMSAPIHMCSNGHSVCASCRAATPRCCLCRQPYISARSYNLESLSAVIPLPCVDCWERMPADVLEKHKEACPNRHYNCLVQESCDWKGLSQHMIAHTSSAHPQQIWHKVPQLFVFEVTDRRASHTYLFSAHSEVFTLNLRYDNKFQAFARYIGPSENAKQFQVRITLMKDDQFDKSVFFKNVCVDTENIELLYKSNSCVVVNKDMLQSYLYSTKFVCEVEILKVDRITKVDNIIKDVFENLNFL